jgi:hypothetical protein
MPMIVSRFWFGSNLLDVFSLRPTCSSFADAYLLLAFGCLISILDSEILIRFRAPIIRFVFVIESYAASACGGTLFQEFLPGNPRPENRKKS